jgi:iron complex transport system substrate-binding protein
MRRAALILGFALLLPAARAAEPQRIVTAGPAVTEIVCALGLADRVVAVDTSSQRVPGVAGKPDIGYQRILGAEGVLAQKPDLVLVSGDAGPPAALEQIRATGTPVVVVESGKSLEGVAGKIRGVARAVHREAGGEALVAAIEADLALLREMVAGQANRPTVIFLHARGGNNLMAAGTGTAAHAMIEACGGRNACADFQGYKPLSAEAFAAMAPDCVIVSESIVAGDAELIASVPGLAETPAAKNGRVIRVDDAAFLGFGPRSAATAKQVVSRFPRL